MPAPWLQIYELAKARSVNLVCAPPETEEMHTSEAESPEAIRDEL